MNKRKNKPKGDPFSHNKPNCHNCCNCEYIGEGDYMCSMNNDIVIAEWQPTEDYCSCEGKDFEKI